MTDAIADLATRIRNAYLAKHERTEIPHSRVKEAIAKILEREGYVGSVIVEDKKTPKTIMINLLYKTGQPVIGKIERVSTSGKKIYLKANKIPKTLGGYGITIISTSRGIMTDIDARRKKVGGEVLLRVW